MKASLVSVLLVLQSLASMTQRAYAAVPSPDPVVQVTLGQSVVALYGPWKFQIGDDPRWADPAFDDSQWETVDLTPTPQTTLRGLPIPGFVSGWTARGHAGYAGYAWYRMRVRISGTGGPLVLLAPEESDGAFQVFVDGRLVGSSGNFNRSLPEHFYGKSPQFSVSASDYRSGPNGATLVAFRFYMAPVGLLHGGTGGMHMPPIIGMPDAANAVWHVEMEKEFRRLASALGAALMYFFFALLITIMFAFNRTDKVLIWPLAACVLYLVSSSLIFSTNSRWMSAMRLQVLIDFAVTAGWYVWLLTWWAYFGLQSRRWLFNTIVVLGIVDLMETEFFEFALRIGRVSHGLMAARTVGDLCISATSFLVMAAIAYLGWKGVERGRWPLFLALFFSAVQDLLPLLERLHLRTSWQPFGVLFPYQYICTFIMLFFFSIVLFQQFRTSLKRQQTIEDDVRQAKEIQRLLIPEQMPKLPGWIIESEYRPAREVGGDFFQIIPDRHDGGLLIVAGDVTGKGLQAGMLVAMLVGAIRTESVHTSDPVQILSALNARLHGREQAQATCLAINIAADGHALLANAGHLPPYVNGEPVDMEGSLPLGLLDVVEFPVRQFGLNPNDRLVLVSDGIVEATNASGTLFGFDRLQSLLRTAKSAREVASAAQSFGQEDDISVIAITHTGIPELASA